MEDVNSNLTTAKVLPAEVSPVRVGIAGVGRTVFEDHVPALSSLNGLFEVVAACDIAKGHREKLEDYYPSLRHYRRLDDMYDDPELEVVLVATPSIGHQKQILAALHRHLWTVAETPPAMSLEGMQVLEKCASRVNGHLMVSTPFVFTPAFELAMAARTDRVLGEVFDVKINRATFMRRDDWQSIMRCGGGIARFAALEPLLAAMKLLDAPPRQLWSELKRVAGVGDAEDHARIMVKTNTVVTADITVSSAMFEHDLPEFEIRGSRGVFRVLPGATEGLFTMIDPAYKLPRRRSSMSTPPLDQPREIFPTVRRSVAAKQSVGGHVAMWKHVYACVRGGATWPVSFLEVIEAMRLLEVIRQTSAFVK